MIFSSSALHGSLRMLGSRWWIHLQGARTQRATQASVSRQQAPRNTRTHAHTPCAALLAVAVHARALLVQVVRDGGPPRGAQRLDKGDDGPVLLIRPRTTPLRSFAAHAPERTPPAARHPPPAGPRSLHVQPAARCGAAGTLHWPRGPPKALEPNVVFQKHWPRAGCLRWLRTHSAHPSVCTCT